MSKAILVIDMPTNCSECKLIFLQGIGKAICDAVDWDKRPSWCPLRPLPEKDVIPPSVTSRKAEFGWIRCIEEILGEK